MARVFIGIGSNIEPEKNVRAAIRSLVQQARVTGISTVYCSGAIDRPEQPHYFNCVVEIETDASPAEVKYGMLRPIEESLERERSADKFSPRTIDLDLIVYGDLAVDSEGITLPDPDILERPFLAIPLFELAPELVLPGYNVRIGDIAARLPQDAIRPMDDYTRLLRAETNRQQPVRPN